MPQLFRLANTLASDLPFLVAAAVGAVMLADYPLVFIAFIVGVAVVRFVLKQRKA